MNDPTENPVQILKKSPRLMVEIAIVLCCKLALIFALWFFFFGPDKRLEQTPEVVASGILDRPAAVRTQQQ